MGVFRTFWYGDDFPSFAKHCAASFLDHGHEYVVFSYDPIVVPRHVKVINAECILPKKDIFFYKDESGKNVSVSAFSNIFRYKLLYEFGGWWVDTDVLCLSSETPDTQHYFGWDSENYINVSILRLPAFDEIARICLEEAVKKGVDIKRGDISHKLFTKVIKDQNLEHLAIEQKYCYPITIDDYSVISDINRVDESTLLSGNTSLLHLWYERFRKIGNQNINYPPKDTFLFKKYCSHHDTADDVEEKIPGGSEIGFCC